MLLEPLAVDKEKVGFFRFKQLGRQYLLTNDIGLWCLLEPQYFEAFLSGRMDCMPQDIQQELRSKGFIRDQMDFEGLVARYARRNSYLMQGPSLHIVVVTLRCDHRCLYCQTSSLPITTNSLDMDTATAQATVDRIFESPNPNITIEFQGGEPLANWNTVKFIIEYALKKNAENKKSLIFSLVSNLSFLNDEILQFLMDKNVSICTSLDGPEALHNRNRIATGSRNSYKQTRKSLARIIGSIKKSRKYKFRVNALATVTKYSLVYAQELVDEYVGLGLEGIHLRPVNPFGIIHKNVWKKIRVSLEGYLQFYKRALEHILDLNRRGVNFYERTAKIFLTKILTDSDPGFLDISSPCGAGTGQLAYNYNGDVYTCDEGRMLAACQDTSFRVGNVRNNSYAELINSAPVKTICMASCLDNLAGCNECVYKPYCGVCPIYNYTVNGSIYSATNDRCRIHSAIQDYLFGKLKDAEVKKIFSHWLKAA